MNARNASIATKCNSVKSPDQTDFLTLGQAGQLAPGRPSSNSVWRWCRRGVKARSGERINLQHVRAGGKIFTTRAWVEEFCHRLAKADEAHFQSGMNCAAASAAQENARSEHLEQVDRELREAGL